MTYKEQLCNDNWRFKRKKILLRDRLICTKCKNNSLREDFEGCTAKLFTKGIAENVGYYVLLGEYYKTHKTFPKGFIKTKDILTNNYSNINHMQDLLLFYLSKPIHDKLSPIAVRKFHSTEFTGDHQPFFKKDANLSDDMEWIINKTLHVHHSYYQAGLMAWEYPDESLTTLCWKCHEELHKNQTVPYLDAFGNRISHLTTCSRCHGAGEFPEYSHVQHGICFRCHGAKFEELIHPEKNNELPF
jgi:hypothetical protein